MTRLLGFLWRSSRGAFLAALIGGIAGGLGGVGLLAMIPRALADDRPSTRLGLAFAGLCLATIAARVGAQVAMIRLAQGSVATLVRTLCEQILRLPLRKFEQHDPARLTAVLTEDVMVLTNALGAAPGVGINLTIVAGCFAYLGWVSPPLLACTLGFAAPAVLSHELLMHRGQRRLMQARSDQDALMTHFRELVEGFKELKLHRRRGEAFLEEAVGAAAGRVRRGNTAGLALFAAIGGWGQFLYLGYLGALVFIAPSLATVSKETLTTAVLTVVYAFAPLDALLGALPFLARSGSSLARIDALGLAIAADAAPAPPAGPLAPPRESLSLRGASYRYPSTEAGGEGFALGPVDLTVATGETLFLVGGNGGGKTTLLKLLTGLYEPEAGEVLVDGEPIDPAKIDSYRQLFSVVFADGFVFPTLHGLDRAGLDGRAEALLAELGLAGIVSVEDGSFSTTRLSQGQRRRLALAAACLEDRPILVFDEWAAYQDPAFRRAFYREILPALKARGKTLIVVTHDEEYFPLADRRVAIVGGAPREELFA